MIRYLRSHVPMALVYGILAALINGSWWPLAAQEFLSWSGFILGAVVGVLLLYLDRVVYTYSYPADQLSQQFAWQVKEKRWANALSLLDARREEQNKLTFRSALFIAIWVPLSFFAITSTAGLFGKGVVMGLMLHILYDSWREQRVNPARLNERLFWQIGRKVEKEEQLVFLYIVSAIFLFFSFWVG